MFRKWDTGTNIRSCTYHTGYKLFIFRAVWNKNVVFAACAVELGSALKTWKFEKWNSNFCSETFYLEHLCCLYVTTSLLKQGNCMFGEEKVESDYILLSVIIV